MRLEHAKVFKRKFVESKEHGNSKNPLTIKVETETVPCFIEYILEHSNRTK
jgi:hypothetical protein